MTSPPEWTRKTLNHFTDAATQAVAKTIVDFQRESKREGELQQAQFSARMAELDYRLQATADLEKRLSERLATLSAGPHGVALTLDEVRPAIADYVDHVLRGWERPKDGTSVTVADVEPVLRQLVSAAVARLQQEQHVSPARHWPPRARWPHDRPIIDIEAAPHPLTEHVTAAVKLLAAPLPEEARQ